MSIVYSLIIVNYHSIDEIRECLESIQKFHPSTDYEVIIVSNSDVSEKEVEHIEKFSIPIKWIIPQDNLGYGRACNMGADESSGDYIFFLNPDTRFLNDVPDILKSELKARNNKAAAGPATYNRDMQRLPSVKNDVSLGWMFNWLCPLVGQLSPASRVHDSHDYKSTASVQIINGSAIFMHKSAYQASGGFSNDFFMYWEENDLCYSLREKGIDILFSPDAKIIHSVGHSTKKNFIPMEIEKHRSQKLFLEKHHPKLSRINRMMGVLAYFWRFLMSLIFLRSAKVKQFRSLFAWYLLHYK